MMIHNRGKSIECRSFILTDNINGGLSDDIVSSPFVVRSNPFHAFLIHSSFALCVPCPVVSVSSGVNFSCSKLGTDATGRVTDRRLLLS